MWCSSRPPSTQRPSLSGPRLDRGRSRQRLAYRGEARLAWCTPCGPRRGPRTPSPGAAPPTPRGPPTGRPPRPHHMRRTSLSAPSAPARSSRPGRRLRAPARCRTCASAGELRGEQVLRPARRARSARCWRGSTPLREAGDPGQEPRRHAPARSCRRFGRPRTARSTASRATSIGERIRLRDRRCRPGARTSSPSASMRRESRRRRRDVRDGERRPDPERRRRTRATRRCPTATTGTPRVSRYSSVSGTSRIAFGPAHTTATGVRASSSRSEEMSRDGRWPIDRAAMARRRCHRSRTPAIPAACAAIIVAATVVAAQPPLRQRRSPGSDAPP